MAGNKSKSCFTVRGCDPALCLDSGDKCAVVAVRKNCWNVGRCGVIGCSGFCAGCWIYLTAKGVVGAAAKRENVGSA
ncbi:MAG: hypothetical protein ACOX8W_04475 [bacterium]|jgi:hypothetical protein